MKCERSAIPKKKMVEAILTSANCNYVDTDEEGALGRAISEQRLGPGCHENDVADAHDEDSPENHVEATSPSIGNVTGE